mmetsp:Transcript_69832/g.194167  ORF Transcript_69832/g.194167 Transcript_69832/m.194167 type:complete len:81 (-) Transcript_69832:227-469(-)
MQDLRSAEAPAFVAMDEKARDFRGPDVVALEAATDATAAAVATTVPCSCFRGSLGGRFVNGAGELGANSDDLVLRRDIGA